MNKRYTAVMSAYGQTGSDTQELEQALRRFLAPDRLPPYIKSARYELGADHIGEPAVRIFLEIDPEAAAQLEKDQTELDKYSEYRQSLMDEILKLDSGYFPFIRLAEAA